MYHYHWLPHYLIVSQLIVCMQQLIVCMPQLDACVPCGVQQLNVCVPQLNACMQQLLTARVCQLRRSVPENSYIPRR